MKITQFISILVLGSIIACADPKIQIENLRTEYLTQPLGLDFSPRLSWNLCASGRNVQQSAYRILVASSPEKLAQNQGDLWDSGEVTSNQTFQIPYAGAPLQSRQIVYWKVMLWDQKAQPTAWSAVARWEMALLQASDWQASWIGAVSPDAAPEIPAALFRKTFTSDPKIKQARLYISGLGYYEARLNGRRIGDHVLSPNRTNYDRRQSELSGDFPHGEMSTTVFYETYDVTSLIQPGPNALGMILGNGWYYLQDHLADTQVWYDTPRLLAQLEIKYSDGHTQIIATDSTWKTSESPIRYNGIYSGEIYDARQEQPGWDEPAFADDPWSFARVVRPPTGKLRAQIYPPDRVIKIIPAKSLSTPEPGIYQFDLGQMISGWVRLKINGPAGTEIKLRFIEELGPSYGQTDTYILKEGENRWEPRFTWHAFRVVQVLNAPQPLTIDALEGCVVNTDVDPAGKFVCSNPLFNQILENYRWTQLGNMHGGVPSDCPHRERRGYTGDGQISARAAIYNFDMALFYHKWLNDIRDAQDRTSGHVPNVAPFEGGGGGTAWGSACVMLPWYMYLYYGDAQLLADYYDVMQNWVGFLTNQLNTEGLLANQGLGEWVPPDICVIPETFVNTCYYFHNLDLMTQIAARLGRTTDAQHYAAAAARTRETIQRHYFNPDGSYSIGWQGADVFPLGFQITPDSLMQPVLAHLTDQLITRHQGHFDTGILATPLLLELLTRHGRMDLAYTLMNQRDFPGYGFMIEQGATTIWETWPGDQSHSHPMFGSVCQWFYADLAGIAPDPAQPGFQHVQMKPQPVAGLDFVRASYPAPVGTIQSHWQLDNDDFIWDISLPANCRATIYIPVSPASQITESNRPVADQDGMRLLGSQNGRAVFEIGSGDYHFKATAVRSILPSPVLPAPFISPGDTLIERPRRATVSLRAAGAAYQSLPLHYTLDGTEPQLDSPLYAAPFEVERTVVVKARSFQPDGAAGLISSKLIQFVDPLQNGLNYRRYDGVWKKVPDFASLKPTKTGRIYQFGLDAIVGKDDLFAAEIFGQIEIEQPGEYTFYALSNDGSRLYLDDRLVVNNDGEHGAEERSGTIILSAGKHAIRAAYFQAGGGMLLKVSYAGPGLNKREIPADVLFTGR